MKRTLLSALFGALITAGLALWAALWSRSHWSFAELAAGGLTLVLGALAICF